MRGAFKLKMKKHAEAYKPKYNIYRERDRGPLPLLAYLIASRIFGFYLNKMEPRVYFNSWALVSFGVMAEKTGATRNFILFFFYYRKVGSQVEDLFYFIFFLFFFILKNPGDSPLSPP